MNREEIDDILNVITGSLQEMLEEEFEVDFSYTEAESLFDRKAAIRLIEDKLGEE